MLLEFVKVLSLLIVFSLTNILSEQSDDFQLASEFEKQFLSGLGLQTKPRIGKKLIEIGEDVIQDYFNKTGIKVEPLRVLNNKQKVEGIVSNTLHSFPGKLISQPSTDDSKFWIFGFDFSRRSFVEHNFEFKEATVRLRWRPTLHNGQKGAFKVKIFDLIKTAGGELSDCNNVDDFHMLQIDVKKMARSSDEMLTIELDATPAVRRWIKKTKTVNFWILVELGGLKLKRSTKDSHKTLEQYESLPMGEERTTKSLPPDGSFDNVHLKVFSQDNEPKARVKRAPLKKKKVQPPFKGLEGICQLHSYYYDFSLGGWDDWIISPKGFHANLCFGYCPRHMPEHMNSTNNAIIQRLMHDTNPEVFDPPCCVPTEYEPLSLLIIEDEETERVNVKTFEKMVVTSCGCR